MGCPLRWGTPVRFVGRMVMGAYEGGVTDGMDTSTTYPNPTNVSRHEA